MTTKKAQLDTFYAQGDFGYVRDQRKEMSIICEPLFMASLACIVIQLEIGTARMFFPLSFN